MGGARQPERIDERAIRVVREKERAEEDRVPIERPRAERQRQSRRPAAPAPPSASSRAAPKPPAPSRRAGDAHTARGRTRASRTPPPRAPPKSRRRARKLGDGSSKRSPSQEWCRSPGSNRRRRRILRATTAHRRAPGAGVAGLEAVGKDRGHRAEPLPEHAVARAVLTVTGPSHGDLPRRASNSRAPALLAPRCRSPGGAAGPGREPESGGRGTPRAARHGEGDRGRAGRQGSGIRGGAREGRRRLPEGSLPRC